jgi:hypothetical protein
MRWSRPTVQDTLLHPRDLLRTARLHDWERQPANLGREPDQHREFVELIVRKAAAAPGHALDPLGDLMSLICHRTGKRFAFDRQLPSRLRRRFRNDNPVGKVDVNCSGCRPVASMRDLKDSPVVTASRRLPQGENDMGRCAA